MQLNLFKRDERRREVHKRYHVPPEARGVGYFREEESSAGWDPRQRRTLRRILTVVFGSICLGLLIWFGPRIVRYAESINQKPQPKPTAPPQFPTPWR